MTTDIKKHSFKHGLPQEFEVVDLGQLYKEFAAEMTAPHRTNFYHIIWFQKGSITHLGSKRIIILRSKKWISRLKLFQQWLKSSQKVPIARGLQKQELLDLSK